MHSKYSSRSRSIITDVAENSERYGASQGEINADVLAEVFGQTQPNYNINEVSNEYPDDDDKVDNHSGGVASEIKEDDTAAFIFLDQEKDFDRVNHKFLSKVMRSFGFGESFIHWIHLLYSNATAVLNINGFLSKPISFNRGVKQGCPLSSLLYVMVIEVLALQLRGNPNIVGFKIGGDKIVSAHYMDDSTIIIKQNRCFKEVIKELELYQEASGAKVNYGKTKGPRTEAGEVEGARL